MKNNFIFMCLALGMLSNGFYNDAFAMNATEQTAENQQHVLTKDDARRLIQKMEKNGSAVVEIENGYTSIGKSAFSCCRGLRSITIPDSVKSIGEKAFYFCESLTSTTIPNSVTSIGKDAFKECYASTFIVPNQDVQKLLTDSGVSKYRIVIQGKGRPWWIPVDGKIVIPGEVEQIEDSAFESRYDITSVDIPDSITSIGASAFKGCYRLTSITIPNSVTSIGKKAFCGCSGLTSITIPNSVTSIGNEAFRECWGLTSITIPNSVTSIGNCAFNRSGLTSITIPNSVTSIGEYAFQRCKRLTSITIPDSVISIGHGAFKMCDNLKHIYVYSDRVKNLVVDNRDRWGFQYIDPSIVEVIKK